MGGSQKYKRITWAGDVNLCHVRLLAKPVSEVGMGRANASRLLQSGGREEVSPPPPGFEEVQPANLWRVRSSRMAFAKWRCPPRFEVKSEWQMACGEESKEIEAQNQRQRRVLEAIYPRPSAIPPSPAAPVDAGVSTADYRDTPLVPLIPIEEADDDNILAAALASVLGDQMKLIDLDLLKTILSHPEMLQHVHEPSKISRAAAGPVHPPQLRTGFDVRSAPTKDMNYYKRLIQQHGGRGERRDVAKTRMFWKPCMYFKSPRGCRNGANCSYQHDTTPRLGCITEVPSAKRVKLSR